MWPDVKLHYASSEWDGTEHNSLHYKQHNITWQLEFKRRKFFYRRIILYIPIHLQTQQQKSQAEKLSVYLLPRNKCCLICGARK